MFFCFVFQLYAFNNVAFSTLCRFWMHLFSPWRECFGSSFWFLLSIYEQLSCVTFFYRRESVFIVSYMHMSVCVCVCECANESVWFYLKVFHQLWQLRQFNWREKSLCHSIRKIRHLHDSLTVWVISYGSCENTKSLWYKKTTWFSRLKWFINAKPSR